MRIFKDINGKEQVIDVNVFNLERVKDLCGIDLLKLFADNMKPIADLFSDFTRLGEVVWLMISQTDSTPEQRIAFLMGWKGDVIERAAMALVDSVIDFFPGSQRQQTLRDMVAKIWEIATGIEQEAAGMVAKISPQEVLDHFKSTFLSSATGSPESPESIQDPLLSASSS